MTGCLLVCTDLDRTLIPNGSRLESAGVRARFQALAARPEVTLAYVTGRHLELVVRAMAEFQLPVPDFIIANVGTTIYQPGPAGTWQSLDEWQADIGQDWGQLQAPDLHPVLQELPQLQPQESSKQSRYKLSYYFPVARPPDELAERVRELLGKRGIGARVICSIDELRDVGLLDVIPERASKLHAIEALMHRMQVSRESVVFSGDSGNDMEVLVSAIPSVLVANASEEIKAQALELAWQAGTEKFLHIATGGFMGMNGCYGAGILEGIAHYHPHIVDWLQPGEDLSIAIDKDEP